ncbi:MAG: dihydroneopterin aldolase [Methylococcales bacterium]|nr:dihydroneopterin aldolase [Methylococcales bacterium]
MDTIIISDINAQTVIGVKPKEREKPQPLSISLILYHDLSAAGQSDAIEDTIHYGIVTRRVKALVEKYHPQLIEAMAAHIADYLLETFPIDRVQVRVEKPQALLPNARMVAVQIERTHMPEFF